MKLSERPGQIAKIVRTRVRQRAGTLRVLWRTRRARVGLLGMVALLALAVLADVLASTSPSEALVRAPSAAHWLGTDVLGRDVLACLIHGTRAALAIGLVSATIVVIVGVALGAISGFYGGRLDTILTRMVEVLLSVPTIVAVLALRGITGDTRLLDVAIVFGVLRWTDVARMIRAEVLRARTSDWAIAAHALGLSPLQVLSRHVLPDALSPAIVAAPIAMGAAIVLDASLAMLGASEPSGVVTWGALLAGARLHRDAWWLAVFPGLALFVAVASFNLVGESLRDALDPQLRALALPGANKADAPKPPPRTSRPPRGEREPTGEHTL
jgi:peptide/nickel transport system permease protein